MTHTPEQIETWLAHLLNEARRDLVFLWNIQRGSFGGAGVAPDKKTLGKVIEGLVMGGCMVGFGDPSFSNWSVPSELQVPREHLSAAIIQFWEASPKKNEFVTFALRARRDAQHEG
jgi:hypothetical protein